MILDSGLLFLGHPASLFSIYAELQTIVTQNKKEKLQAIQCRRQHIDLTVQGQTNGLGCHYPRHLNRITHWRHCDRGWRSGYNQTAANTIAK